MNLAPLLILFGVIGSLDAGAAPVSAKSPATEIHVVLFGQPCLLSGPVSKTALQSIHAISPEQLPEIQSVGNAKDSLEKVRKTADLPAGLDRYRELLTKRLEAQSAFFDKLATARKTGKVGELVELSKQSLPEKSLKEFQALAQKLEEPAKNAAATQLKEFYNENLQPDSEEEFHRAIQRMDVHYTCSFDGRSQ